MQRQMMSEKFISRTLRRIDRQSTHNISFYKPTLPFLQNSGTSHTSVMTSDGASVALTSSINGKFGSFRRGSRTGIIFNDGMDDFATTPEPNLWDQEPSLSNIIEPRKQPLSSMCPTLLLDRQGLVVTSLGGSGGTKITTGVAYVRTTK